MSTYQKRYQNSEVTELVFTGEGRTILPTIPEVRSYPVADTTAPETVGTDALRHLSEVLTALGLDVEFHHHETEQGNEFATMTIRHPSIDDARAIRSRNAGRKPKPTATESPLDDMTPQERLEWLYGHTPEEGCEALGGVSTRTRKRRIAELRRECQS